MTYVPDADHSAIILCRKDTKSSLKYNTMGCMSMTSLYSLPQGRFIPAPSFRVSYSSSRDLKQEQAQTITTMPTYRGSCTCRNIEYELRLDSPDDARTSLCHCRSCKVLTCFSSGTGNAFLTSLLSQKAFGTNYGLTAKVPKDAFHLTAGRPREHAADNGSGAVIYREFCDNCGSFILEYGVRRMECILRPICS
jgi:hypothetical protein